MNLQFYLEKLFVSENFENFKKENPEAYFCSGFFSIEGEKGKNNLHIDYFNPETKKMFSFQLESDCQVVPIDQVPEKDPVKIPDNIELDFDKIREMVLKEMESKKINKKIQKMLFSLQHKDGKNFLIGTIFISGLGLLKIKFDLEENKITDFEKKSFFDMMKIIKK